MNEREALDRVAKIVALLRFGDGFRLIDGDEEAVEVVLEMATKAWLATRPATA